MPLALAWEDRDEERVRNLSTAAVAKVRQQASVGVMGDAFADEAFCRALVAAMAERREIATAQGKLQFRPTAAFARLAGRGRRLSAASTRPQGSSSNTVVVMGERLILKGYRRLRAGVSPELEMGLYLTEVVHYRQLRAARGRARVPRQRRASRELLALLQAYVANQGDGWTYSLEYLRRHLEEHRTAPASRCAAADAHEAYLIADAGARACAPPSCIARWRRPRGIPAFDPEPLAARRSRGLPAARGATRRAGTLDAAAGRT